jgi:hypothetical protein
MESLISAAAAAADASGRSWDDGSGGGGAGIGPLHPSYRRDGTAISSIRRGPMVDHPPREDVGGMGGNMIGAANVFLSGHQADRHRGLAGGDPWRDRVQA